MEVKLQCLKLCFTYTLFMKLLKKRKGTKHDHKQYSSPTSLISKAK